MKFLNFGLFTLSALVATSAAAPAPQGGVALPAVPAVPELGLPTDSLVQRTDDCPVNEKVKTCVVEVKKHCSNINSTLSSYNGQISGEDKTSIIAVVHTEVTIIISLVTSLTSEILGLVGTTLTKVQQDELVSLVLELIFEILYTLKNVLAILKITIFELLGNLIIALLSAVGHLLVILNVIVDGLLKIVFGVLADVVGLLSIVLKGLLPIITGIVGGLLGKVFGLLSCLF